MARGRSPRRHASRRRTKLKSLHKFNFLPMPGLPASRLLLLLAKRYGPLALTILGPIIFNLGCFLAPSGGVGSIRVLWNLSAVTRMTTGDCGFTECIRNREERRATKHRRGSR